MGRILEPPFFTTQEISTSHRILTPWINSSFSSMKTVMETVFKLILVALGCDGKVETEILQGEAKEAPPMPRSLFLEDCYGLGKTELV